MDRKYQVYLEGRELPIRTATIFPSPYHRNQEMEYVQFTTEFPICIKVVPRAQVKSARIRPKSLGLVPVVNQGAVTITLDRPVKFSLEFDDSVRDNLLVLAEEDRYGDFLESWKERGQDPGQSIPGEGTSRKGTSQEGTSRKETAREGSAQEGKLLYFGPGVQDKGVITVKESDTTIYLEEGAYIHGKIDLDHCDRVKLCGYGIISMEQYPYEMRHTYQRCINAMYCRDLCIQDITILDSNDWSLRVLGCENVLVDNVKIIGCRGNSDGVDICGSSNVLVQHVFTRVWDDSLVVKGLDAGDVENVTFRSCILWNDFARPMEVGVELRADKVHHVRFQDIDVLHSPTGYPLMGIHHGDRAEVSDIVFEDIRIEDAPGAQLFDIRITPSYWNRDQRMGRIRDVAFRRIQVLGEETGLDRLLSDSRLQGYSREYDIRNVTFEEISILGKQVHDAVSCGLLCMEHVSEVAFVAGEEERLAMVESHLAFSQEFHRLQDGTYEGVVEVCLRNPGSCKREKEIWLQVSPAHVGDYDRNPRKVCLPGKGEARCTFPLRLPPGKYVIALQSGDPEVRYAWRFLELDWVLPECGADTAIPAPLSFVNYYGDRLGSVQVFWEKEGLVLRSGLLQRKDCILVVYGARPVPRQEGEVAFSVEETDFGVVPAVLWRTSGWELAPQLRCPLEITLVFRNEPKVEGIRKVEISGDGTGECRIAFADLGLPADTRHFWLEIEARLPEVEKYRYPYTLFHSVIPGSSAHMYGVCRLETASGREEERR